MPPTTSYGLQPPRPSTSSYRDPPPVEVYTLPDAANASIPPEIREQFDRDEQGRVLFFTAPPVQVANDSDHAGALGHSIKYLAAKSRREEETSKKRKAFEVAKAEAQREKKKVNIEEAKALQSRMSALKKQALVALENQLAEGAKAHLQNIYGNEWEKAMDGEFYRLAEKQNQALKKRKVLEEHEREKMANSSVRLGAAGTLLGDN